MLLDRSLYELIFVIEIVQSAAASRGPKVLGGGLSVVGVEGRSLRETSVNGTTIPVSFHLMP